MANFVFGVLIKKEEKQILYKGEGLFKNQKIRKEDERGELKFISQHSLTKPS